MLRALPGIPQRLQCTKALASILGGRSDVPLSASATREPRKHPDRDDRIAERTERQNRSDRARGTD